MKKIILLSCFLIFSLNVYSNENGRICNSDFQCESLCCNQSSGTCSPHDPANNLFCSKEAGESCLTSNFCKIEVVVECKIVKSGLKPDGTIACTMKCPAVMKQGKCLDHVCYSPEQPPVPPFDPNDCSKAVDP